MSDEYTIYALRGNADDPRNSAMLSSSLENGEGRFGWSYIEGADLHKLKAKIEKEGWDSLSDCEKDCYQPFLLDLKRDDYVIYINVPQGGQCTLARVTGPYRFRFEDKDFNHRFPVDPGSVYDFYRNHDIVRPALSRRLKLQGRWWRIYDKEKFEILLNRLKAGEKGKPRTSETSFTLLEKEIEPDLGSITKKIHETYPNKDLEELLVRCFKNVPSVRDVKRKSGRSDHGADLLVVFKSEIFLRDQYCVVQAKSYEGELRDTQAVKDIEHAFKYYADVEKTEIHMGMIVSTASQSTDSFDEEMRKLEEETGKPVELLIGRDLAEFVLRFGRK